LFRAAIGEPVMDYIKKRRLALAGVELIKTDATVLDIALRCGYSSHEGFTRAFTAQFGTSPLKYRKRHSNAEKTPEEEEIKMTNESIKKIAACTNDIARDLERIAGALKNHASPMRVEIEKTGRPACGIKIAYDEWANLIAKIEAAAGEIKKTAEDNESFAELYAKTEKLMKVLDDIFFQMNLLRFMTGVERARMGDYGIPFDPILSGLTALCETENKNKASAEKLIGEIGALSVGEIKNEAADCLRRAAGIIGGAVSEGEALAQKIIISADKIGSYNRGFLLILNETKKSVSDAREFEAGINQTASNCGKADASSFFEAKTNPARAEMSRLMNAAFRMNLNAFNAAVESARAGDVEETKSIAKGVTDFAGTMQRACKSCDELIGEFEKLTGTLRFNEGGEERRFSKTIDDIVFQARCINTQLSLESERANRDEFRAIAHEFEDALAKFSGDRDLGMIGDKTALKLYREKLQTIIEGGNETAAAAGAHGAGILYILKEYETPGWSV